MNGEDRRSLEDSQRFKEARRSLPKHRFASVYIDPATLLERGLDEEFLLQLEENSIPDWVTVSAGIFDRALVAQVNVPTALDHPLELPNLQVPDDLIPRDAPMFLAASFDPNVNHWRQALREYDDLPPDLVEAINGPLRDLAYDLAYDLEEPPQLRNNADPEDLLDLALDFAREITGINMEYDLIAHLSGMFAMALHDLDLQQTQDNPLENAIPMVAMLSHRSGAEEELQETMDDLADLLEDKLGIEHMKTDLGGDGEATIYPTGLEYQPGHMLHREFLLLGSTEKVLAHTARLEQNPSEQLRSDQEYQRIRSHLPEKSQLMLYLNLGGILEKLNAHRLGIEERYLRVLQDTLGRLALSSYAPRCENTPEERKSQCESTDNTTTTLALTLLEK